MKRNNAYGMLWGLIVGDALGSPIQFSSKDGHPWIKEMLPCPGFGVPAGCWTDDGSMALCVMDSYVRTGKYDLADIGKTFVRWYSDGYLSSKDGESFDVGIATAQACHGIASGRLRNGHEDTQGNGSIMRLAPSYLIARKEGRTEILHEVSDLTHNSSRVRQVIDRMAMVLDEHLAGKRTTVKSAYKTREEVDNSGWAVSTLEAALWAFEATTTFEDGMIAAVNLGGDSDTIGAVYGQIAGAYYGLEAIPMRWIERIKNRHEIFELTDRFIDKVVNTGKEA